MGNNFKTTLILLFIAVSLSVYAHYFEGEGDWEAPVGGVFTSIAREQFVELELIPGPGVERLGESVIKTPLKFKYDKQPGELVASWKFVEPFKAMAFTPRVEGVLNAVIDMQRIQTLTEDEVAPYFEGDGLAMTVKFRTKGPNSIQHTVEIGRDNPDKVLKLTCVRIDGKDTFHIQSKIKNTLRAGTDMYRSRALFPITQADAVNLSVTQYDSKTKSEETFTLERPQGKVNWSLTSPSTGVADRVVVQKLLDEMNAWKIEEFVSEKANDQEAYGLNQPRLKMRLESRYGQVKEYLVSSKPPEEGSNRVYVLDTQLKYIYSVESELLEILEKPPEYFRSRTVIQLGASSIVKVEGTRSTFEGDRSFVLAPDPDFKKGRSNSGLTNANSQEEAPWNVDDQHLKTKYTADKVIIGLFLKNIKALPVVRYVEKNALVQEHLESRSPLLKLSIGLDTKAQIDLSFYEAMAGTQSPETHYLVTQSENSELALVRTNFPLVLENGGIFFRERNISGVDLSDLQQVDIMNDRGRVWTLMKTGGLWKLKESNAYRGLKPGKSLNEQVIFRGLNGLSRNGFRVLEYLPQAATKEDLRALELIPGRNRIQIDLVKGFNDDEWGFRKLIIGARKEQSPLKESYALINTIKMPFTISQDINDGLVELVNHLTDITEK